MKGDCDEYHERDDVKKLINRGSSQGKIKNLLADLLEKEEELAVYKKRLKELEAAFYYNLELISERDLELSILEKQLAAENEQLEDVIRERNELEELIKTIDEKKNKKIKQLETKLNLKEEEIKELQRENVKNINNLKQEQEKKMFKMSYKFESQKNELMKNYREEMEEKEKYYLLEINNLSGKLEQACKEKERLADAEEEIKDLKNHLEDLEKLFLEKENKYLEEIKKINKSYLRKVSKEVQCAFIPQMREKIIETESNARVFVDSETMKSPSHSPREEEKYKEKINFLQEQNEVLKFIIKDLKRNRECVDQPPGCECERLRGEVEKVNQKFESEISNLKKILEKEQKTKKEEDAVIRSLEMSVTSLKNKLLLGLQEKQQQLSGNDIYNHICDTEIQMTLLEERLSDKIDAIKTTTEQERQKVEEKLEKVKNYIDQMEKCQKSKEEESKSENLVEKIRKEIQKLETRIESDLRNILGTRVACATRCDKNSTFMENECEDYFPTQNWDEKFEIGALRKRHKQQMTLRKFSNNLMVGR